MSAWTPDIRHRQLPRTVAAYGLAGSLLRFPDSPLDDREFSLLLTSVVSQRLTGLLWDAVATEALPATPSQTERVEWLHVEALSGALALERLLLDTVAFLEAAGVPARVLKGPAVAHLDYPDAAWRTFGDIDLLVRGRDFDQAVNVLRARGHQRLYPEPRPGFDRRFSKGTSFRTSDGLEIDLHRTFTMGPLGVRLDVAALWERHETFELGGHELTALPVEERFLHACYHAILGEAEPRLVPLRDVAQLALTRDLDLARIHHVIRTSGGESVVSRAVRHAWRAFDLADVLAISAWAETYRTNPREAADLAVYDRGSSYARKSWAAVRALPTLRDRLAFLYALAAPTRAYLDDRHPGRLARLRSGIQQSGVLQRRP